MERLELTDTYWLQSIQFILNNDILSTNDDIESLLELIIVTLGLCPNLQTRNSKQVPNKLVWIAF